MPELAAPKKTTQIPFAPPSLLEDPRLNKLEGLVQAMKNDGVGTAGQAFLYGDRTISKPSTYVPVQQRDLLTMGENKVERAAKASLGFVGNLAKTTAKNVYGLFDTALVQPTKEVTFQATHNWQNETQYYREANTKASNEYLKTKNQIIKDFQSGAINKSDYEKQLNELDTTTGQEVIQTNERYQIAKDRQYKWKDWQTGEYKTPTIGDVFNIVDGAITLASLGTAGLSKAGFAQTANMGVTKILGRDMIVGGLEKIGFKGASADALVLAGKMDNIVSNFIQKVPGLREYSNRQIAKLGADLTAKKFVTNAIAETLLHAPLREMNMESAQTIVNSVRDGKFLETPEGQSWLSSGAGQALMMAGMTLEGGPIGFLTKTFGKIGSKAKIMTFGSDLSSKTLDEILKVEGAQKFEGTFLDHIFKMADSEGNAINGWKWLAKNKQFVPALKSIQESIASGRIAGSAANAAFKSIEKDLLAAGKEINIESVMGHMLNWQKAGELAATATNKMVAKGILQKGQIAVVTRFSKEHINQLVNKIDAVAEETKTAFKEAGTKGGKTALFKAQQQAAEELIGQAVNKGEYWAQHDGLVEDIVNGIRDAKNVGEIKKAVKSINAAKYLRGVPPSTAKQLRELGYIISIPKTVTNPFITRLEAAGSKLNSLLVGEPTKSGFAEVLGLSKKAPIDDLNAVLGEDVARIGGRSPMMGAIGNRLEQMGVGVGNGNMEAYRMVMTNAAENIDKLNTGTKGVSAIRQLQQFAENSKTIGDLRQMTVKEIARALNLSDESARSVQKAIVQAHLEVPIAIRGLADRAVDVAMKLNIAGKPLQGLYARTQGALRYTYNPFFRVQEAVETKLLGAAATDGKTAWMSTFGGLAPKNRAHLNEVVDKMTAARMFDVGTGGAATFGEGATNAAIGRVTARIGNMQKRDLAAVVDTMAEKYGMTVDDLLATRGQDVIDVIRPIVQYPTKGIINSNFAKMANLVAFPTRYNAKVTMLAAQALTRQTPVVQGAVLRGLADFNSWLKSPDGLSWQQDYANEIRFMKWITPINSIDATMKLLSGNINSWADVGQLGGLPFGLWTQILNDQGIIDSQTPYVDPKTGNIFSTKVPETVKGRMAMAIMDMLGSAFTFPGRTVGLPGKQQTIRDLTNRIVGTDKGDFSTIYYDPSELSPEKRIAQKFWQERFKANGVPLPIKRTQQTPMLYNGNLVAAEPRAIPKTFTKSEINVLKVANKATTGKKKKQPVDFNAIINR